MVSPPNLGWYENAIGLVAVRGRDRHGLLHRLCSQDILPLAAGDLSAQALLTTHQGRLIDWLDIFEHDETLWLKTSAGRAERVLQWLEQYIIMEDVACHVAGEVLGAFLVLGATQTEPEPAAGLAACAEALGLTAVPAEGVVAGAMWSGQKAVVKRAHRALGEGIEVINLSSSGACADHLRQQLGAPRSALELEGRRLLAGLPSSFFEYQDAAAPFELRLVTDTVHWHKGCYIGQEVISRMEAYDKVARLLMGVRAEQGAMHLGQDIKQARLWKEGKSVGRLTSFLPNRLLRPGADEDDGFVGLALLKRESAVPGQATLEWPRGEKSNIPGTSVVVELEDRPFWSPSRQAP